MKKVDLKNRKNATKGAVIGFVIKRKVLLPALATALIALSACEDILSTKEEGEKASAEFCECMKENSLGMCENELNAKYSYYTDDNEFIKAFNDANDCNITISKKK
jgi:hypothetical protein